MRAVLAVAALLLPGCIGLEDAHEPLPERLDHDGEPPVPTGAAQDGPRRSGRCFKDAAFVFVGRDVTFTLPLNASVAEGHAGAWANATLAIVVSSPGFSPQRLNATPLVLRDNGTTRLAFHGAQGDEGRHFISEMAYGQWYPWNVTLDVRSHDPATQALGYDLLRSGWILVAAGGKPGQSDDQFHVYLARERLPVDPFHRIRFLGGDLFVSARGVCAD